MGNQSSSADVSRRYDTAEPAIDDRARKLSNSHRGSTSKFTFPAPSPRPSQSPHTITVQQRRASHHPLPQLSPLHITDDLLDSASADGKQPGDASASGGALGAPRLPTDRFQALVAAQMLAISQRREDERREKLAAQPVYSTPAQREAASRRPRSLRVSPDITPNLSPKTSPKSSAQHSPLSSPPLSSRMNALHISALTPRDSPLPSPTHSTPTASPPLTPQRHRPPLAHRSSRRWSAFEALPASPATAQFASDLDAFSVSQLAQPSQGTLAALWLHYQPKSHSDLLGFTALLALAADVRCRVMRHRAEEELRGGGGLAAGGAWEGREWDWLPGYEHDSASSSVQCVLREVCRQLDVNHDGNVRRSEFDARFGAMVAGVLTKKEREREHRRRKREKQLATGVAAKGRSDRGRCSIM